MVRAVLAGVGASARAVAAAAASASGSATGRPFILFAGFAWFELIDPAPDDPARLAAIVGRLLAGQLRRDAGLRLRDWSRRGEFLSVFFGMISRFAHLRKGAAATADAELSLGLPGAKLSAMPARCR